MSYESSLEDVHTRLGYTFKCSTCFLGPSPVDELNDSCREESAFSDAPLLCSSRIPGIVSDYVRKRSEQPPELDHTRNAAFNPPDTGLHAQNEAYEAYDAQADSHQSDGFLQTQSRLRQSKKLRFGPNANPHRASLLDLTDLACFQNSTKISENVKASAQDEWLQTFAQVDEINPSDMVNSVLHCWDTEESERNFNSFFRVNQAESKDTAVDMHGSATVCRTKFPYASQQVFIRMPVVLPYESAIFSSVQSGDIDGMRVLLASGVPIDAIDPYGLGLLYVSRLKVKPSGRLTVIPVCFLLLLERLRPCRLLPHV